MPDRKPKGGLDSGCSEKKKEKAPGRNSWTLSWLAERADGWRDEVLELALRPTEGLVVKRKNEPKVQGEHKVCDIETPSCQPTRKKVRAVILDVDNSRPEKIDPKHGWDAVFWTESAVEKFLYPYYHSHRIWDKEMDEVKEAFEAYPGAMAIKHKAPSNSAVMKPTDMLQIGAVDLEGTFKWMPASDFIALVTNYLSKREPEAVK